MSLVHSRVIKGGNLVFLALFLKLLLIPWTVGVFSVEGGAIINYCLDGVILGVPFVLGMYTFKKFPYIYIGFFVTLLSYLASTAIYTNNNPFAFMTLHMKIYGVFITYSLFWCFYELEPALFKKNVKLLLYSIIVLSLLGFFFLPGSINRLVVWLPSYFGALHSTAYVIVASIFITSLLLGFNLISKLFAVSLIITLSLLVFFGWGVRTAALLIAIYFTLNFSRIAVLREGTKLNEILLPLSLLLLAALLIILQFLDGATFASGRLAMYEEKIIQLADNNLLRWAIGNGYGSDLINTDIWWWAAKGAHSDFLTMLVEGGSIYLLTFLSVCFLLLKDGGGYLKAVLIALLFSAMFSNGVFVRPAAGYLCALALVLARGLDEKSAKW